MDQLKRYQIFVSSTFTDLKTERGKVMETILSYDCFPAGMEMFPAMDEEQFEYIKRIIDDSDYYLLIIGGRYGSMDKDGKSWTEKEYDYAVSKGIPVIIFDHEDFTKLPANKTDQNDKKRRKLVKFKKKAAERKLIKYWTNADDLALAVATSLKSVFELKPRNGWVRADTVINADAQKEIESLKVQIMFLEAELKKFKKLWSIRPKTKTFTVNGVSFKMVYVKGGNIYMEKDDARPIESNFYKITLSDYWIGETQVTQALWQAVMGKNPSEFKGNLNRPVECVSWEDCQEFIHELNKLTGNEFHLPTEPQWKFAALGGHFRGDNHYWYAGSNNVDVVAWFADNSGGKTHPVGEKEPNELGLFDMSGNVWELCENKFANKYYSNLPSLAQSSQATDNYHVLRGGSWNNIDFDCLVSHRGYLVPLTPNRTVGLRLALSSID